MKTFPGKGFFKIGVVGCLVLLYSMPAQGQGCSDAGFCTVDALKNDEVNVMETEKPKNTLSLGGATGVADYSIAVYSAYLNYARFLTENFRVSAKLTYLAQSDDFVQTSGFSDVYLTGNYFTSGGWIATLGIKIPLNDGGKMKGNTPLPMDYQSSLGTFDLIAGAGYRIGNFQGTFALQLPLTQNNNSFLSNAPYLPEEWQNRQSTNEYVRKPDVMLRLTYALFLGEKFTFTPGLLPIYHIANDEFTDPEGVMREIEGSQGLTLNGTLFLLYEINTKHALELSYGMPFITREARPDGLTRKYVLGLDYSYLF